MLTHKLHVRNGSTTDLAVLSGGKQCWQMKGFSQCLAFAAALLAGLVGGCGSSQQSHTACPLPRSHWSKREDVHPHSAITVITVAENGKLRWNGEPITRERLTSYFRVQPLLNPQPFIILQPQAGADCALVESLRDEMDRMLGCATGPFCGEGNGWEHERPASGY